MTNNSMDSAKNKQIILYQNSFLIAKSSSFETKRNCIIEKALTF